MLKSPFTSKGWVVWISEYCQIKGIREIISNLLIMSLIGKNQAATRKRMRIGIRLILKVGNECPEQPEN